MNLTVENEGSRSGKIRRNVILEVDGERAIIAGFFGLKAQIYAEKFIVLFITYKIQVPKFRDGFHQVFNRQCNYLMALAMEKS